MDEHREEREELRARGTGDARNGQVVTMSDRAYFARWQVGVLAAVLAAVVLRRALGWSAWAVAPLVVCLFPVTLLAALHIPTWRWSSR